MIQQVSTHKQLLKQVKTITCSTLSPPMRSDLRKGPQSQLLGEQLERPASSPKKQKNLHLELHFLNKVLQDCIGIVFL